jgi:hypothetical protein
LRSADGPPLFIINHADKPTSGWNWGDAEPLRKMEALDPGLFRKLSRRLAEKERVVCFVDYTPGSEPRERMMISPNLFAWARTAQVPVVFMIAQLGADGCIRVTLEYAPSDDGADLAAAFVRFVARRGGWQCELLRRKSARGDS